MTMLKILCKLVSKQQSNSMLKKVKSLMRNASSYPLSNLWCYISIFCGLTFALGKKLAGSNTGVLRNWEVFFNYNEMVSDTSGRSKTKIFA